MWQKYLELCIWKILEPNHTMLKIQSKLCEDNLK